MKPNKSQSALEFLVLAGVMMLFFIMFFYVAGERIIEMNDARRDKIAGDIMDTIINELELAQGAMDGYTRNFTMPEYVEGSTYEVHINSLGEGKNILSLRYMDKIYMRDVDVNIDGTANSVYKGINQVSRKGGKIRVLNGDDPCNKITAGQKSYCLGGKCYCYSGNYAYGYHFGDPANICKYENDIELTTGECPSGCRDFDYCNPPPAIVPIDNGKAVVLVPAGRITDTKAMISFGTNESARAVVDYGIDDGSCEFSNTAVQSAPATLFNILLSDLRADTKYCFEIEVEDAKGAKQYYIGSRLSQSSFTTSIDTSPPLVRYAAFYPVLSAYNYGDTIELMVNITDDSGIDLENTEAVIKQKEGENLIDLSILPIHFVDTIDEDTCGISLLPTPGNEDDDSGYIKCFEIDSDFARYASYGADSDTLFYASYDSSAAAEKGGISQSIGTEMVPARYGSGIHVSSGDTLRYPAKDSINENEGTIEFWMKRQWLDADQQMKIFFDAGSDQSNGMDISRVGANLYFRIIDSNPVGVKRTINPYWPIDEDWHFIAATWKGLGTEDSEMHLYFDGEELGSIPEDGQVNIPLSDITGNLGVGDDMDESYRADSIIDQFRILGKARSLDEIKEDYGTTKEYYIYIRTQDKAVPPHIDEEVTPAEYKVGVFPVDYGLPGQ